MAGYRKLLLLAGAPRDHTEAFKKVNGILTTLRSNLRDSLRTV
jgi:hypothetical protein